MQRYLTTPIYYASGSPHLGHTYTTLIADFFRRYYQAIGDDVILCSGTDEHGQKIERTAARQGQNVRSFVAERSREFSDLWDALRIHVDTFERTSGAAHRQGVLEFWQKLSDRGDIYKSHYEGLYCVECEQYFVSGDECEVHRRPLEQFSEESYFFRLSRYQQRLVNHIETNPSFITPAARRNEVLSFLRHNTLRDLSVSRTSTKWGIPVPGDPQHVVYVWIDALVSYLTALADPASQWRNVTHFIGKDILTFHAIYWPALLWSAGYELPDQIVVNGWLTVSGRKIAKSDPATIVDPAAVADRVTVDGLKYYFTRSVGLGADIDFDEQRLVEVVNADIANGLGNLVSRYTALLAKHFPEGITESADAERPAFVGEGEQLAQQCWQALHEHDPGAAGQKFAALVRHINTVFQQAEPWKLNHDELRLCLQHIFILLQEAQRLACIFVPDCAGAINQRLGLAGRQGNVIKVEHGQAVFPRLAPTTS